MNTAARLRPGRPMPGLLQTLALALGLGAFPGLAQAAGIQVLDAWIQEGPPSLDVLSAYMELENDSAQARTLVAVQSPIAERVEIHGTRIVEGVARMRQLERVSLPAGSRLNLAPGGMHLMLINAQPLRAGARSELELQFENGERLRVPVEVRAPAHRQAAGQGPAPHAGHGMGTGSPPGHDQHDKHGVHHHHASPAEASGPTSTDPHAGH